MSFRDVISLDNFPSLSIHMTVNFFNHCLYKLISIVLFQSLI